MEQHIKDMIDKASSLPKSGELVDLLVEIARKLLKVEGDQTLQYAQQALDLAQELGYKKGIGSSLLYKGASQYRMSLYNEALANAFKAFDLFAELDDKKNIFNAQSLIGSIYYRLEDYFQALDYHSKNLKLAWESGQKADEAQVLNNIGLVYLNLKDYENALDHFQKSLKITQDIGEDRNQDKPFMNLAIIYQRQGNFSQAVEYFKKSLSIKQKNGDKHGEAICLNNMGSLYHEMGDNDLAMECLVKSHALAAEYGHKLNEAESQLQMAVILIERRDAAGAQAKIDSAQALIEQHSLPGLNSEAQRIYHELWVLKGDYAQALEYYKKYHEIRKAQRDDKIIKKVRLQSMELEQARREAELSRTHNAELAVLNASLQEAMAGIKTLTGLIPICAGCKKIRNDQGYWQQVEEYVKEHSEAEFSHGLCDDCTRNAAAQRHGE